MKFYTNVHRARNGKDLLVTGYDNGKPFSHKERYEPYLFLPTENPTGFRTLDGRNVEQRWFNTMWDARQFIKKYEGVENFEIFGLDRFEYVYLYDKYHGEIKYDPSLVSVVSLDIEVAKNDKGSFASVENADGEITLITLSKNGKKVVFGCGEYKVHAPNIQYYRCVDERAMLMSFLTIWNELHPDILTGWNIDFYDIPMLVNRINRTLGEEHANRMSPWRTIDSRDVRIRGRTQRVYELVGISILDYLALYQKFTYTNQESYKLDHIAFIELDERKLDYTSEGYATLQDLYEQNFQLYTEYNIRDVELVDKLDDKMKLIELVMAMAYDAKVNYNDTLATVRPWDALIHNFLMDRRIVVHQFKESTNFDTIVGGHVKQPVPGMYNWVASFDLNSLYPHLIQQFNISPDAYVGNIPDRFTVDDLLDGQLSKYKDMMLEENVTIAANGTVYSREKQGFLSEIMEKIYDDRVVFKKKMLQVQQEYEKNPSNDLKKEIARLNNMQMAKKIFLNSGYGAFANRYFRWFDNKYAEAITMSGQLAIRWIENKINLYLNKALKTGAVDYVIAVDTDSVYICFDRLIKDVMSEEDQKNTDKVIKYLDTFCQKVMEPFIEKSYEEFRVYVNGFAQKMKMKRESLADRGIWTAKKRYILNVYNSEGVAYAKPKLKITGIEAVKSSTPIGCQKSIKEAIGIMMNGSEADFQKYIDDFRTNFKTLPYAEVASPRSVNDLKKWQDKYTIYKSGTPINVKGALYFNHFLGKLGLTDKYEGIFDGDKIKYAYLKTPNPFMATVISTPGTLPKEFELEPYIDYDKQFEKAFLDPITIIAKAIGWETEKRSTLMDFFS